MSYELQSGIFDCAIIAKILIVGDSGTGKTSIFNKFIDKGFCEHTPSTIGIDFHSVEIKIDKNRLSSKLSSKLEKYVNTFNVTCTAPSKNTNADKNNHNVNKNTNAYKNRKITKEIIASIKEKVLTCDNHQNSQNSVSHSKQKGIKLQLWDAAGQEKFRSIIRGYYRNTSVIILVYDQHNKSSFDHLSVWADQILESHISENALPLFVLIGNKNDLDKTNPIKSVSQEQINDFCDRYDVISHYSVSAKFDEEKIKSILTDISHELYFHLEFVRELHLLVDADFSYSNKNLVSLKEAEFRDNNVDPNKAVCCLLL